MAVILAAATAVSVISGCAGQTAGETEATGQTSEETEEAAQSAYLGRGEIGGKWYASCIAGAVDEETTVSLKDDFFTAANLDYLTGLTVKEGQNSAGVYADMADIMQERALKIIKKEEPKSQEEKLVQQFYELSTDWEGRDKAGLAPATEVLEQIRAIRTVDDIAEYEKITAHTFGTTALAEYGISNSLADPGSYTVTVTPTKLFLGDSKEYAQRSENGKLQEAYVEKVALYMLERFGIPDEEAGRIWEGCMAFEAAAAEHILTTDDYSAADIYDRIINIYTLEELEELQGNYPLTEILEASGGGGSDTYLLTEPEWLSSLSGLYVEENVDMIRDYLLVHYVFNLTDALDRETYDTATEYKNERYGMAGTKSEEEMGMKDVDEYLSDVMDYAYIDEYCSTQERQEVVDIIEDFISYYRKMLEQEDWLSEEMKEYAVEKLDHIAVHACFSDTREDYSKLSFASKAEGGTFWEALQAVERYKTELKCQRINQKVDPDQWDTSLRAVNAYYNASENAIYILCGILVGDYDIGRSYEEALATVGMVIGHEISHAFDTTGSQFDKDGNYKEWWTEEDHGAFLERAEHLGAYMEQIIPYEGAQAVKSDMKKGEMIADLGGMKAGLMMAEDIEDFDYDLFFRAVAKSKARIQTKNVVDENMLNDVHPLDSIRANIMLQNFDEFLETYDIGPGDGMYLSPEERVNVW